MSEPGPAPAGALDVGIHYDVPHTAYHQDPCIEPSLSRSLCWTMAQHAAIHGFLKHPRLNPDMERETPNELMSFGDLAHELILGRGERVELSKWKDFKTDAAKAWRDDCWRRDMIPTKPETLKRAELLQTCALAHIEELGFLADFQAAKKEVTVIGKVGVPGIEGTDDEKYYCRARFDGLHIDPAGAAHRKHSEIAIGFDIKITGDASPEALSKLIGNQGYDVQEKFYLEVLNATDPKFRGKTRFVFFFIESAFPHVVTAVELDATFRAIAGVRFQRGFSKWARGIRTGEWPGFAEGQGTFIVGPKRYLEIQELEDEDPVEGIRLSES